jgi:hypothetical protein
MVAMPFVQLVKRVSIEFCLGWIILVAEKGKGRFKRGDPEEE